MYQLGVFCFFFLPLARKLKKQKDKAAQIPQVTIESTYY